MKSLILLMAITFIACASVPPEKLLTLEPGMSRKAVMDDLGTPTQVHFVEGWYILTYNFGVNNAYDLYFNGKDELYEWEPVYRVRPPASSSGRVGAVTVLTE